VLPVFLLAALLIVPVKTGREVIVCRVRVICTLVMGTKGLTQCGIPQPQPNSAPPPPDVLSLKGNVQQSFHSGTIRTGEELMLEITFPEKTTTATT